MPDEVVPQLDDGSEDALDRLAHHLACNHLDLSSDHYRDPADYPRDDSNDPHKPGPVVVVIGAGASDGPGLPLGNDAYRILQERLHISPGLLKNELARLELEYRLKPKEFETRLLAMSRFARDGLVKNLAEIYGHRYHPTLTYEILAHLLKHRFVDAIINFNFDELLDQSIEDEIGSGNYKRIISDGDCPSEIETIRDEAGRFRVPLYIKPHGTASHKSAMRFTRGGYFLLPGDIRELLETLFKKQPVRFVLIGHEMQSFEFNGIISKKIRPERSEFYVLNLKDKPDPLHDAEPLEQFYKDSMFIRASRDGPTLDALLERLWDKTCKKLKDVDVRGISRHTLLCEIFANHRVPANGNAADHEEIRKYLCDRTFVELALAIAKAKGFVILSQLANGRTGKYFNLYKKYGGGKYTTLLDFCEDLRLAPASYSGDALRYDANRATSKEDYQVPQIVAKDDLVGPLAEDVDNTLAISPLATIDTPALREVLGMMYDKDEVEVVTFDDSRHFEIFKTPTPLSTLTSLKLCTKELLNDGEWDALLCIAETGEWLLKQGVPPSSEGKARRVAVIVADPAHSTEIKEKLGDRLVFIKPMPWWLHNQHMTLFLEEECPTCGIYFERRLRSAEIAPVKVGREGAKTLLDTFVAYLLKAERSGGGGVSQVILRDEVTKRRRELLREMYGALPSAEDSGAGSGSSQVVVEVELNPQPTTGSNRSDRLDKETGIVRLWRRMRTRGRAI